MRCNLFSNLFVFHLGWNVDCTPDVKTLCTCGLTEMGHWSPTSTKNGNQPRKVVPSQCGVSLAVNEANLKFEVTAIEPVTYSTIHPRLPIFHPECSVVRTALEHKSVFVVVDRAIDRIYGPELRMLLQHTNVVAYVTMDGREKAKNWQQVQRLCNKAIGVRLPRDGTIVAIGGGVTLDVAGFVAAIFRRGVEYVRIPTSLIGMVDVGVGIKQAINVGIKKNIVGAFYPATTNINDPAFLASLPERHLSCGLAEIIKIAMMRDAQLFSLLEVYTPELLANRFQGTKVALDVLVTAEQLMMKELSGNLFERQVRRLPDFGPDGAPPSCAPCAQEETGCVFSNRWL